MEEEKREQLVEKSLGGQERGEAEKEETRNKRNGEEGKEAEEENNDRERTKRRNKKEKQSSSWIRRTQALQGPPVTRTTDRTLMRFRLTHG